MPPVLPGPATLTLVPCSKPRPIQTRCRVPRSLARPRCACHRSLLSSPSTARAHARRATGLNGRSPPCAPRPCSRVVGQSPCAGRAASKSKGVRTHRGGLRATGHPRTPHAAGSREKVVERLQVCSKGRRRHRCLAILLGPCVPPPPVIHVQGGHTPRPWHAPPGKGRPDPALAGPGGAGRSRLPCWADGCDTARTILTHPRDMPRTFSDTKPERRDASSPGTVRPSAGPTRSQ